MFEALDEVPENLGDHIISRFGIQHLDNYQFTKQEMLERRIYFPKHSILDGDLALALQFSCAKTPGSPFFWEPERNPRLQQLIGASIHPQLPDTTILRNLLLAALVYELPLLPPLPLERVLEIRGELNQGWAWPVLLSQRIRGRCGEPDSEWRATICRGEKYN